MCCLGNDRALRQARLIFHQRPQWLMCQEPMQCLPTRTQLFRSSLILFSLLPTQQVSLEPSNSGIYPLCKMEARLSSLHLALAATIDKLSEMYETVQTIQAAYLDDDDLRNLKIKVNSQISWNPQNGSGNEPCFCDPVLPHEFDELFQHKPSVEWPWAEEVEQEFKDENQKHFFEMSARGRKARSSHWDRAEATKVWLSRHLHYSLSNDDDLNFYCHTFWIKTVL